MIWLLLSIAVAVMLIVYVLGIWLIYLVLKKKFPESRKPELETDIDWFYKINWKEDYL